MFLQMDISYVHEECVYTYLSFQIHLTVTEPDHVGFYRKPLENVKIHVVALNNASLITY